METNPILKTQLGEIVHTRNEQYQSLQLELDLVKKLDCFISSNVLALVYKTYKPYANVSPIYFR